MIQGLSLLGPASNPILQQQQYPRDSSSDEREFLNRQPAAGASPATRVAQPNPLLACVVLSVNSTVGTLTGCSLNSNSLLQSFGYHSIEGGKKRSVRFAGNLVSTVNVLESKTPEEKRDMYYSDIENMQMRADLMQTLLISRQPDLKLEDFGESIRGLEDMKSQEIKRESVKYRSIYIKTVVDEYRALRRKNRFRNISYYSDQGKMIYELSCRHTQYHREEAALLGESDAAAVGISISSSNPDASSESETNLLMTNNKRDFSTENDEIKSNEQSPQKQGDISFQSSGEDIKTKISSDLESMKEKIQELQNIIQDDCLPDNEINRNLIVSLRACQPRIREYINMAIDQEGGGILTEDLFMECLHMNDQLGNILSEIDSCLKQGDKKVAPKSCTEGGREINTDTTVDALDSVSHANIESQSASNRNKD